MILGAKGTVQGYGASPSDTDLERCLGWRLVGKTVGKCLKTLMGYEWVKVSSNWLVNLTPKFIHFA